MFSPFGLRCRRASLLSVSLSFNFGRNGVYGVSPRLKERGKKERKRKSNKPFFPSHPISFLFFNTVSYYHRRTCSSHGASISLPSRSPDTGCDSLLRPIQRETLPATATTCAYRDTRIRGRPNGAAHPQEEFGIFQDTNSGGQAHFRGDRGSWSWSCSGSSLGTTAT